MRILDLQRDVLFAHCISTEPGPAGGIIPLRFTAGGLRAMPEPMRRIARMGTSVELQIAGRPSIVQVRLDVLDHDGYGMTCEAYLDGAKLLPAVRLQEGQQTVTWHMPTHWPGGTFRLLFPTHCTIEVISIAIGEHDPIDQPSSPWTWQRLGGSSGRWLVYGDSITQGANVSAPSGTWVELAARQLRLDAVNLSIGGYGVFEEMIAKEIVEHEKPDLITLHCGINFHPGNGNDCSPLGKRVTVFISAVRERLPSTPILVATPIWSLYDTNNSELAIAIRIRQEITIRISGFQRLGDRHLHLVDGLEILENNDGLLTDDLHLCDYGAMRYAQAMTKHMAKIVGVRL